MIIVHVGKALGDLWLGRYMCIELDKYLTTRVNYGDANHYEKKGLATTGLAIQFLSCNDHLQLIVYIV